MEQTGPLAGKSILVVEDEYLIADDLHQALNERGATVIGPAPSLDQAVALIDGGKVDLAILDMNLQGRMAFSLAERLARDGVPFVVASGYGAATLPPGIVPAAHLEKPCPPERIVQVAEQLIVRTLKN